MAKKIFSERKVKQAIIKWLSRIGYNRYLKAKEVGEHGVDIKVRHYRYPRYFLVELKGEPDPRTHKSPASAREVNFNYVLGQIVTRMRYKAKYKYGIGLPVSYEKKVMKRLPWQVCKKLNLSVLLVKEDEKVKQITWKELKKSQ